MHVCGGSHLLRHMVWAHLPHGSTYMGGEITCSACVQMTVTCCCTWCVCICLVVLYAWVWQPRAVHGCGGQPPVDARGMGASTTWFACHGWGSRHKQCMDVGFDHLLLHMVRVYMPHGYTGMGRAATCSACMCGKVPGRYTWYGCIWHMFLQT